MKSIMLLAFSGLIAALLNNSASCQIIEISPRFLSLQIGETFQLTTNNKSEGIIWKSNNPLLQVSNNGLISTTTTKKPLPCTALVFILNSSNLILDSIPVSVISWTTNMSKLVDGNTYQNFLYLGHQNDSVYSYNFYTTPYIFLSQKDLEHPKQLAPFHKIKSASSSCFLTNKFGYLIKDSTDISFSRNLKDWDLVYKTRTTSFRNSICQYFDTIQNKFIFFTADYHTIDSLPISIYRGEISSTGVIVKPVYTFPSRTDFKNDNSKYPQARHVHTITVDPFTKDIWVGTGDDNSECFLMYSSDSGNSWNVLGTGSQEWRTLAFWFTERYIYWSMDTGRGQKVFRISRDIYNEKGYWVSMTPVLLSGNTKPGVTYFIRKKGNLLDVPNKEGTFYIETMSREIPESTELVACNDSVFDYRETVANLENSAHWLSINVTDSKGDQVVLLSTDSEGKVLDDYSRVFGLKERIDGTVDVQEVFSIKSTNKYTQLMPCFQNSDNSILYWGYYTDWKIHKMTLDWNDNSQSIGGFVKEDINLKSNYDLVKLKLEDYDGEILNWQKCDKSMIWKSIKHQFDTITVQREPGIHYYRAIVKKENQPAVSAKPAKIFPFFQSDNIGRNAKNQFLITPNPAQDKLTIFGINISESMVVFEIFNIEGKSIFRKSLIPQSNSISETVDLTNHVKGVYIVKIYGINTYVNQKVILN